MIMGRKKIKAIYMWLLFLVTLVLGILLVMWASRSDNTFVFILMVIDFILMTIAINAAIAKTFVYKPKARKCVVNKYNYVSSPDLDKVLVKAGFMRKGVRFGHGYIKIEGDVCYKVVVIDDYKKYFTDSETIAKETKEEKPTAGIEKCNKFIGFEIFYDDSEDLKQKVLDFAMQGEKLYYDGFYVSNDVVIEPNHIKPNEAFMPLFNNLLEYMGLNKIEEQE